MARRTAWELSQTGPVSLAEIDLAICEMEAVGFLVDVEFCARQSKVAEADEDKAIRDLDAMCSALGYSALPDGVPERWHFFGVLSGPDGGKWKSKKVTLYRPATVEEERVARLKIWSSPVQLRRLIHDAPDGFRMRYSPIWKKGQVKLEKGEVKIDEAALDWLVTQYPQHKAFIKRLIDLRRIRGCKKYLRKLPLYIAEDGRVHVVCGPAGDGDTRVGAVTGRLAMKNPEGQQIPRNKKKDPYRIRKAVIAGPGMCLVVADYSALEVVILAHICKVLFGDTQLEAMVAPGAPDIHSTNARNIFGNLLSWTVPDGYPDVGKPVAEFDVLAFKCDEDPSKEHPYPKYLRDLVKTVWYGLQYGKGAYGFGNSLLDADGVPIGEERAGLIVEGLLDSVPALRLYQEWVREFILKYGGIPSLDGRWCDLLEAIQTGDKWKIERAWRQALNFPMQSGGAAIIGAAMVQVSRDPILRALGFRLILQVHDELVLEGPIEFAAVAVARVSQIMRRCFPLAVPLQCTAHSGPNWEEAK